MQSVHDIRTEAERRIAAKEEDAAFAQAMSNMLCRPKNVETAPERTENLQEQTNKEEKPVSVENSKTELCATSSFPHKQIIFQVAYVSDLTISQLTGDQRFRHIAYWRHIAMYLLHRYTKYGSPHIAKLLGRRDHTTVLYAIKKINNNMHDYQSDIRKVEDRLMYG